MTEPDAVPMGTDPLEMDSDQMRRLGYQVIDVLVDRLDGLEGRPVWTGATRAEIDRLLREPSPEEPADPELLVGWLAREILPLSSQNDHPRFFAYVPACPTWPSILGDMLSRGTNTFAGMWLSGAGLAGVEVMVLDWFKDWIGYPAEAGGLLVSGGSAANLTGLACGREAKLGGDLSGAVAYATSQVHHSNGRALRVLGFREEQLRVLEPDADQKIPLKALRSAIERDRAAGRRPWAVLASGGTTNSGAVDPLTELAELCKSEDLWLHVDAAYGGFAALTERGRAALQGLELADSISLDPHKWLFQPYEAGCVLVRESALLESAFKFQADYHQDIHSDSGEVNFSERGIELTRPSRALKIWLSLKTFGVGAFRQTIDRSLDLALEAEQRIQESAEFELLTPASLGVVCFRRTGAAAEDDAQLDELNADLVERLKEDGEAMISSTQINGVYAMRLCILNHRSGPKDVHRTLQWLEKADFAVSAKAGS